MCQVHGSQCVFVDSDQSRRRKMPTSRSRATSHATSHASNSENNINLDDDPLPLAYPQEIQATNAVQSDSQTYNQNQVFSTNAAAAPSPTIERSIEGTRMSAMLAESGDSSTHIISPAIADDNEELDSYLSSDPAVGIRRITRTSSTSTSMGPPSRRVLFNTVLRKPLGINANQSVAAGKLEVIEKLLEPHVMDMINLHVTHAV